MELKLIGRPGQVDRIGPRPSAVRARLQRALVHQVVTAYLANARQGNARAEGARRGQQVEQEAVAPEGHRPRARRQGVLAAVARRRKIFPTSPGRELHAEGQPQDVSRGIGVDPLAARPRGPAGRVETVSRWTRPRPSCSRRSSRAWASDDVLVVTDSVDENLRLSSRNLPNVLVVEPTGMPIR